MQSRVRSLTLRPTRDAARKSVPRTCVPATCLSWAAQNGEFIFAKTKTLSYATVSSFRKQKATWPIEETVFFIEQILIGGCSPVFQTENDESFGR